MQGQFFWYDVMTTDTRAAETFYRSVVGWETQAQGYGYTVFTVDGLGVAGLMKIPEDAAKMGAGPFWMGYIYADDVDALAKRVVAEGGKLHKGPITVEGIIRFAVVTDPQGAAFMIATPLIKEAPPRPSAGKPGTIGWHELYAADGNSAFGFYEKLFGWKKKDALDMGAMGTYQLFATTADGANVGGVMTKTPDIPAPFWSYYFNVNGIYAALERVTAGGGKPIMGPHQVPTGQWILQALDPQGAPFALLSDNR